MNKHVLIGIWILALCILFAGSVMVAYDGGLKKGRALALAEFEESLGPETAYTLTLRPVDPTEGEPLFLRAVFREVKNPYNYRPDKYPKPDGER